MTQALEHHDDPIGFWRNAYEAHGPAVLAFLRGRLHRTEDAEDVLQETFVRAMNAGSIDPQGPVRAYLMSTARNLVINRLRRPRRVVAMDAEDQQGPLAYAVSEDPSPERRAALGAFRDRLADVVATMSDAHRTAFRLGLMAQHSYNEIARMTGWTPAQVKINVYRARQRIIRALGDELPETGWRQA